MQIIFFFLNLYCIVFVFHISLYVGIGMPSTVLYSLIHYNGLTQCTKNVLQFCWKKGLDRFELGDKNQLDWLKYCFFCCNTEFRLVIDESSQDKSTVNCRENDAVESEGKRLNKLGRCRSRASKSESPLDSGVDAEGDLPVQGAPSSREERVSSLKTVSSEFASLSLAV